MTIRLKKTTTENRLKHSFDWQSIRLEKEV
jgi:hypothetical protein